MQGNLMQRAKNIIYDLINFAAKLSPQKIQPKKLLLVKTNEIGDYILWRNVLPYIKNSEKYTGFHITLLGNSAWKDFFETFDSANVDDIIWVNRKLFKSKITYRYRLLKTIRKAGFEIVINTITSRCKREDDAFVLALNKSYKIGNTSDPTNVLSFEKGYDKNLYNQLYNTENAVFEFEKNVVFTEYLLQAKLPEGLKPKINVDLLLPKELEGKKYFIVFTGSSRIEKIWPTENFISVTTYVAGNYPLIPVTCGSKSDEKFVGNFLKNYNGEVINMCGKTSLVQFANILKHANFLISIDTGAVHIAATVGCPVFGIFNGTRYGRFAPYPSYIASNFYSLFPDEVDVDIKNGNISKYTLMSPIPYSAVSAQKVIAAIDHFLKG